MLHELLLALAGDSGGIFVYKKSGGLQVAGDLPFIHTSEVALLNRICKLGSYFKKFRVFSRKYTDVSPLVKNTTNEGADEAKEPFGLYIQAFCTGLDKVLVSYTESLVELEQQILKDPKFPLTHIEHSLEQYQVLFPALAAVIEQIQGSKASGCRILDILYESCICGVPDVKEALERILWVCHRVMYQQLSAWLLNGMLIDNHREFFICEVTDKDGNTEMSLSDKTDSGNDLGIPGITGKQLAEIMDWEVKQRIPIQRHFRISAEMLPSYIPTRVAEKILFIGEAMQMFEKSKTGKGSKALGSIIRENEELFMRSLHTLQQHPTFNLMAFESEVDKIRKCVAEHLWKLVVEEGRLLQHLMMLKDFFLLGRGEVFSAFIEHAMSLLKVPPMGNTSQDANAAFQQVLHKFLPDDDEFSSLFSLAVDTADSRQGTRKRTGAEQSVISGWDLVKLKYDVQWPLHILLQPAVLDKYNTLFRYLLNVKRTQQDLQQLWAVYMDTKHSSPGPFTGGTKLWLLRMHMAFLVDNLQYYLQVDVLETQYSQLVEKVNSTRDFESIRLAHDHFITTLMAQSFLLMKPVAHSLEEILSLCQSFCALLMQASDGLSAREEAQIENISKCYKRQARLLFDILSSVRSHQASPHLAQLLLRIDFNKHFSSSSAFTLDKPQESSTSADAAL